MLLSILIFGPLVGAIVVYFAGFLGDKVSKALTILFAAATVGLSLYVLLGFNWGVQGFQLQETYNWAKDFGLTYVIGVDGISVPLLIISTFLTTLSAAGSWEQITTKVKEYNALLLLFEGAIIGVFTSLNLVAFYVFWELVLIPMFFFIGVWGGPTKTLRGNEIPYHDACWKHSSTPKLHLTLRFLVASHLQLHGPNQDAPSANGADPDFSRVLHWFRC